MRCNDKRVLYYQIETIDEWEGLRYPYYHITDFKEVCLVAKKVIKIVKLQIPAGKANPAPPVGPALGQAGVNIMGFCKEFNARTADQAGLNYSC